MVDCRYIDILESYNPSEFINHDETVQQEEQIGGYCSIFPQKMDNLESFRVDDKQTVMVCLQKLSYSLAESDIYVIQRRLLPKFYLVNSATFPEMFNPKLFWMSHDSRKLILVTEAVNSEIELKVYDTLTCFKAFTLFEQDQDIDILRQTPFIFSIKMQSDCQVANAFLSKDYQKLVVLLDFNQQTQDEIDTLHQETKSSDILMLFDIKDALNKTISLSNDKLIEIQKEQKSNNSQVIMIDEMYILNFKSAFDSSIEEKPDQKDHGGQHLQYTVQINQDISSHQLILSFKSLQTEKNKLMIVDFNNPLVNKIVEIQNFNSLDKIEIKDDFIVHVKYNNDNIIIGLNGYQYDIENQTLRSQFQFESLIEEGIQIQIVNIEKDKHITYLIRTKKQSKPWFEENTEQQVLIQHSFQNQIYIYQDVSQFLNTQTHWNQAPTKKQQKFDPDLFKGFNISKVYLNPFQPKYIVYSFTNGAFAIAKHQERRSIFRSWSTEKDQGFSFEQLELEAKLAFDDIVQNKVKLINKIEPVTYMMVRDIATPSNSENESKIERWLGFYRNGAFYNFKRFENYTLKNIPLINFYYKRHSIMADISTIEFYLYNENELTFHSVPDKFFKNITDEIKVDVLITLNEGEQIKQLKIERSYHIEPQLSLERIYTRTLIVNTNNVVYLYAYHGQKLYDTLQIEENDWTTQSMNGFGIQKLTTFELKNNLQVLDFKYNPNSNGENQSLKARADQYFKVKLLKAFYLDAIIQSEDNRLFLYSQQSLNEIVLPAQYKDRNFKIKCNLFPKAMKQFKLIFNECLKCSEQTQEDCLDCANGNWKRYTYLKVIMESSGTSKGSFQFEGFIPDFSYFKYYDDENNRYDFYDTRTNLKISSVETAFYQAEARFLQILSITPNRKIFDLLRRNQPLIKKLIKCHGILGNLLDTVNQKETILEALLQELTLFQKEDIPMLFIETRKKPSALGSAIKTNSKRCVKVLLDIFIEFQDHFVTGLTIDKNIVGLIRNNYDVKELLEREIIMINLNDIQELPLFNESNKIEYFSQNFWHKPETMIAQLSQASQPIVRPYSCEYKASCMRSTISDIDSFFKALRYYNNLEIFENEVVQLLIDYHWSDKVVLKLKKNYMIFLVFLGLLILNVLDSVFNKSTDENQNVTDNRIGWLVTCQTWIICIFNTYYLVCWILMVIRHLKDKQHTKTDLAINLIFILFTYPIVILNDSSENHEGLLTYQIALLIIGYQQLNFHLQVYEGFSFMIQMFYEAFVDLKFFVAFFVLIIVEFALLFLLAFKGQSKEVYDDGIQTFYCRF
eukprot:403338126